MNSAIQCTQSFLKNPKYSPSSWIEGDLAWRRESSWLEKRGLQNLLIKLQARVLGGGDAFSAAIN